jgi:ABC-2 type transport system ATP-binding protein
VTIVLTTHDMDEAAELADRVGIMDHGRLLALDTPAALTASVPGSSTLEAGLELGVDGDGVRSTLVTALGELPGVERCERVDAGAAGAATDGGHTTLRLYASVDTASLVVPVAQTLAAHGAALTDVRLGQPTLEDVFIGLTGRALR